MRPYRGKRIDNGEEVKGWYVYRGCVPNDTHYIYSSGFHYEVDPKTVRQFICKDKNGKDVFAGDKAIRKEPDKDIADAFDEEQEIEAVLKSGFLFWDIDGAIFCPADEIGEIELIEEQK